MQTKNYHSSAETKRES